MSSMGTKSRHPHSKGREGEIAEAQLEFVVDPDAEPGDVTGALASLLISLAQQSEGDQANQTMVGSERNSPLRRTVNGVQPVRISSMCRTRAS